MTERRLTRKEAFEVWVPSLDANVKANALPWRQRNDLGNIISKEFAAAIERAREQSGDPYTCINYDLFLGMAYPGVDLSSITYEELMPLLHFMCEANGLDAVLWMLDPEVSAPNFPMEEKGPTEDGQKTQSTDGSSLPDLQVIN